MSKLYGNYRKIVNLVSTGMVIACSVNHNICMTTALADHKAVTTALTSHGFSYIISALYAKATPRYIYLPHASSCRNLLFFISCTQCMREQLTQAEEEASKNGGTLPT